MDEAGVDRVVIVPPSWEAIATNTPWAAKKWPKRFAVMGGCGSTIRNEGLPRPGRRAPGMLGVRHLQPHATARLTDGTRWFLAAAAAGIPVMTPTAGRARDFLRIVE